MVCGNTHLILHRDSFSFSQARCRFYIFSVICESPQAQSRGWVFVISIRGCQPFQHFSRAHTRGIQAILACFPTHIAVIHAVMDHHHEIMTRMMVPMVKFMYGRDWRQRFILHSGHDRKVLQELAEYGLYKDGLHREIGGTLEDDIFDDWLRERRVIEEEESPLGDSK